MPDTEVQSFTVNIDLPTWKRLKVQALEERRPMSVIIREATRTYLDIFEAKERNGKK